ncbi:Uma2 family endonuclease, partial [Fervidibacter sacchari]
MVNTVAEMEVLEEKMPESPWHNEKVRECEDMLREAVKSLPTAVVFRDLFFHFKGKRYAPDLAIVLQGAPPIESIGLVYRIPEDGPAPDAIIEVAVSSKSLGEALGDKVEFYAEMGVKDYLVIQAFPEKPVRLWFCHPNLGELPRPVNEAVLQTLGLRVLVQGQKVRIFDREGNEILPLREAVERERQQWKEVEQRLIEVLEQERKKREELSEALERERRRREELEKRVAELERKLRGENF